MSQAAQASSLIAEASCARPTVDLLIGNQKIGGLETHAVALAGGLLQRGLLTGVVSWRDEGPLFEGPAAAGIPSASMAARAGVDFGAIARLAQRFDQKQIDVVVGFNQHAFIMAALAVAWSRRRPRLLASIHSSPDLVHPFGALGRIFRHLLKRADAIVFVSELQRSRWLPLLHRGAPTCVIFNGIDAAFTAPAVEASAALRQRLGWSPTDFVVGLCAQMRTEKRIEDLVAAVAMLQRQGCAAKMLLIGDGALRAVIEQAAADQLAPGSWHVTGFNNDVASWMCATDAMALVSSTEAFSVAVLEAMACARPLVLSRVGGAEEQVEDGVSGLLFEAGDVAALAAHLHALASDPSAAKALGQRARQRVMQRFSSDAMFNAYERLLRTGGRSPDPSEGHPC